jgi:hypothetical protein
LRLAFIVSTAKSHERPVGPSSVDSAENKRFTLGASGFVDRPHAPTHSCHSEEAAASEESIAPNSIGSTPGGRDETFPLQENDGGLTPVDSLFV